MYNVTTINILNNFFSYCIPPLRLLMQKLLINLLYHKNYKMSIDFINNLCKK